MPADSANPLLEQARGALARSDIVSAHIAASEAVRKSPKSYEAMVLLGDILAHLRRPQEASEAFTAALKLRPASAEVRLKLGKSLHALRRLPEAEAEFRRAVALRPGWADASLALAKTLHARKNLSGAIEETKKGLAAAPDDPQLLLFLATTLGDAGRIEESLSLVRRLADESPENLAAVSRLLMTLNYRDADPLRVCDEHVRRMEGVMARIERRARDDAANTRQPERRLTVGIVSPDFFRHVCMRFMLPLIDNLDRAEFRLVAYASVSRPDALTEYIRSRCDLWRDVFGVDGRTVADTVRSDGVDVLIDAAGHTVESRLDVFARRAAPVQCTWLGYPNTTGLREMDWRIVDAVSDPAGAEAHSVERLLRVDPCTWCYRPPEHMPEVAPSPAAATGRFTFGSFNNLKKISPTVVSAWGSILARSPKATLLLKDRWIESPGALDWVMGLIEAAGARRDQVEPLGFAPAADFLATYARVDLQLDPFPYNGTTTTCESLWLGVPVLTLEGKWHAARVGTSLMTAAGLPEFIAPRTDAYIEKAVALANDPSPLIALRPTLRRRIEASPLRDEKGYAQRFGAALRSAWREWCERSASV
jgi:protein O-GlcNAc transferase